MAVVERFKAKASKAKMAQSMLKKLDKEELLDRPDRSIRVATFQFPPVERAGKIVLGVKQLSKTFDGAKIFNKVGFEINRGDKVALVASNGKGKSTLLNLIAGKYPLEEGTVHFGHNVSQAFFEQDQEKSLDLNKTILDEVTDACFTSDARQRVRGFLGSFLFPGDDVNKKIHVLSGGEKNRVAMVKVLLQNANLLLLDEPTNHLDIPSKQILLQALQQYDGTMLFVSHDRDFLDGLATKVLELTNEGVVAYEGNYESYLYQKQQREAATLEQQKPQQKKASKQKKQLSSGREYELRKQLGKVERGIEKAEHEIKKLQHSFDKLTYGTDAFAQTQEKLNGTEEKLEQLHAEWEEIMAELGD